MSPRHLASVFLLSTGLVSSGCTVYTHTTPVRGSASVQVQYRQPSVVMVGQAPPAVRVAALRSPAPSANAIWVDGYWNWTGQWVWQPGQWVSGRDGQVWEPPVCVANGSGGYEYYPGHFRPQRSTPPAAYRSRTAIRVHAQPAARTTVVVGSQPRPASRGTVRVNSTPPARGTTTVVAPTARTTTRTTVARGTTTRGTATVATPAVRGSTTTGRTTVATPAVRGSTTTGATVTATPAVRGATATGRTTTATPAVRGSTTTGEAITTPQPRVTPPRTTATVNRPAGRVVAQPTVPARTTATATPRATPTVTARPQRTNPTVTTPRPTTPARATTTTTVARPAVAGSATVQANPTLNDNRAAAVQCSPAIARVPRNGRVVLRGRGLAGASRIRVGGQAAPIIRRSETEITVSLTGNGGAIVVDMTGGPAVACGSVSVM